MVPESVRRRINIQKRPVTQNARTINNTRYYPVGSSAVLEKRISNLERRLGFLTDALLGLISACFAAVGAVYAAGGVYFEETFGAAILAFFIAMWMSNFLFPKVTRWCLERS